MYLPNFIGKILRLRFCSYYAYILVKLLIIILFSSLITYYIKFYVMLYPLKILNIDYFQVQFNHIYVEGSILLVLLWILFKKASSTSSKENHSSDDVSMT